MTKEIYILFPLSTYVFKILKKEHSIFQVWEIIQSLYFKAITHSFGKI